MHFITFRLLVVVSLLTISPIIAMAADTDAIRQRLAVAGDSLIGPVDQPLALRQQQRLLAA